MSHSTEITISINLRTYSITTGSRECALAYGLSPHGRDTVNFDYADGLQEIRKGKWREHADPFDLGIVDQLLAEYDRQEAEYRAIGGDDSYIGAHVKVRYCD